jgi:hypothetical protein
LADALSAHWEFIIMILPLPFVDLAESGLRLGRKVCIVAPGPNGRGHYQRIPTDFQIVAVSKAVRIPGLRPAIWMMTHSDQPWFAEANRGFHGIRIFSHGAALHAADALQGTPDCYFFVPPSDSFLELEVRQPLDDVIRYGATVSACAIQFAYIYGATEILLCGVDLSGDEYFDGAVNINANHGDSWPAAQRLQPLLKHLIEDKGLLIATLSATKLELPTYGV